MDNKLYQRIKDIRSKKGYKSQQAFADDLHVSIANVKSWESAKKPVLPRLDTLLDMCKLFNCDLDYLVGNIEQPTHDIKFIHEKTGLSVEAIEILMANKQLIEDSPLSEIITNRNAERLLRLLALAADEDEIAWLNLNEIPQGLLSSSDGKPTAFTSKVGADVASYLVSQEMGIILTDVRDKREKEKPVDWRSSVGARYRLNEEKQNRDEMLERIETDFDDLNVDSIQYIDPERVEKANKLLEKMDTLIKKIKNASFAEWKRGDIEREYKRFYGEE